MADDTAERAPLYEVAHDAYHEARESGVSVVGDLTRHITDAVLDALGLEQVGWLWRKFDSTVWRHTPVDQDAAEISRHHPLEHLAVYRLRAPTGRSGGAEDGR